MHRVPRDRRVMLPQWQYLSFLAFSPVFAPYGPTNCQHPDVSDMR